MRPWGAQEPPSAPPAAAPAGRKVLRLRFEGNRRYTGDFLREQIATKEGQVYDSGLIARDSQVLRQYFATVADTVVTDVEGGVEITFVVLDKLVVGEVILEGLARVREDHIRPLLSTRPGRPLLEQSLESDRDQIERLHLQKGYRFVDVHYYRRTTKKADVEDVVFQVLPGRQVKVYRLIFEGAYSIDRDKLARILRNSDHYRKTWLGLGKIFSPSYYDRAAIEADLNGSALPCRGALASPLENPVLQTPPLYKGGQRGVSEPEADPPLSPLGRSHSTG